MPDVKMLLFVGTEGLYHDHEGQGQHMAGCLAESGDIEVDLVRDYAILADGLQDYDTILLYTDMGHLTPEQESGLLSHVRSGAGLFGLHTAAASFRENEGYHGMLNAFFDGHSRYMDFQVDVTDTDHPITRGLTSFTVTDELYYLRHDPGRSHHLMQAYDPTKDSTHVMAFHHTYGRGRVFYFALGHDMAVLDNPSFQTILRRGVLWTAEQI